MGQNGSSPEFPKPRPSTKPQSKYDLVQPCHPSDLCEGGEGFWPVNFAEINMDQWIGHVVGVLGQYNKGKTWMMGRLSDCETEGMTVRTEGISFKRIKTTGDTAVHHHLVADMAGFHSPIVLSKSKQTDGASAEPASSESTDKATPVQSSLQNLSQLMQQSESFEQFLISLTLAISNYVIIVMNEITLPDLRFLLTIVSKWGEMQWNRTRDNEKCQDIFVVHNFRNTTDFSERDKLFKQSTEEILDGRMIVKDPTMKYFVSHELNTRHVCLMQDKSKQCQEYNNKVFAQLKHWIHNILQDPKEPHTPKSIAVQFADRCTTLLNDRGYLLNIKEIRLEESKDGARYVPKKKDKEKPIEFATSQDDKYYGLLAPFRPTYTMVRYRTKSGDVCKLLRLEVPGVREVKVKKLDKASMKINHWAFEVSGSKVKTDYGISEIRQFDEIKENSIFCPADDDALVSKEPDVDCSRYGDFHEVFEMELQFKRAVKRIGPRNGILYAFFEPEPQPDDDSFETALSGEVSELQS